MWCLLPRVLNRTSSHSFHFPLTPHITSVLQTPGDRLRCAVRRRTPQRRCVPAGCDRFMSQERYLGPTALHCPIRNHQELNAPMSNPRPVRGVSSAGEMFPKRQSEWIPVEARFSAPVQTGRMAYPTPCTMSTGSFLGVKRPECCVDHPPPPPSSEGKEKAELYLCSPLGLHGLF
jgi:hypothetical protein